MTDGVAPTVAVVPVDAFAAPRFAGMTFPAYQPLLATAEGRRRAVAVGLVDGAVPIGLGLVELRAPRAAQLRSIFVAPAHRRRGHARRLVDALEARARALDCTELRAVYMSGRPSTEAVERLLAAAGFAPPAVRMYVLRCTFAAIQDAPWLTRARLGPDLEVFPWRELRDDERAALVRRQEAGFVSVEVFPFNFAPDFEPVTSLGLRHRGEVVGWCVNHRYDATTLRLTCSYLRDDLQKLGRLAAVYALAIARMPEAGFDAAIWTIPVEFPRMVAFARRRLLPYASITSETRGTTKRLDGASA